jgi:hypothetical protein
LLLRRRQEGVAGEVRVEEHPGEQVAGRRGRTPRVLEDRQAGRPEQITGPAVRHSPELEARLGEDREAGQHAGEDDRVGLVRALGEAGVRLVDRLGPRAGRVWLRLSGNCIPPARLANGQKLS